MDPWYKHALPRQEVREGRSFNPDEFAIALEQVVFSPDMAPADYARPEEFFARTYFTRALLEHCAIVLRRLAGETANAAPVTSFITQFGGGKTHTLTALYHLASNANNAARFEGIDRLLRHAELEAVPKARAAVFVGNAWDPQDGKETPWLDLARQIGGAAGVAALGPAAITTAPGTEAIARMFATAGMPVLLLLDEVLNFVNRHRGLAEGLYSFIQNLTVAAASSRHVAAVLSLPKSRMEMTPFEQEWQERIHKVVNRVAKDLISNEESEVSEVVRRRLFESLGPEPTRRRTAKAFADWCFDCRAQLPPEWTAVDAAASENRAREVLRERFEACFPFHPSTLSVFQRKWAVLPQYQQTRGTLAMLALWLSRSYLRDHQLARSEPLITLGSAPLEDRDFIAETLSQLGDDRLSAAIAADISVQHSHAAALDADTRGPLRGIHRRVGTAIVFECSGGQKDKLAHLPELRFALGGPDIDTTTIDNAAAALEGRAFFLRRVGTDGFRIGTKPKLNKIMADRRASLDEEREVKPAIRRIVEDEFRRGAQVMVLPFEGDPTALQDTPRLGIVVVEPNLAWTGNGPVRQKVGEWTRRRGNSDRLYPGSLIWCLRKPGRDLNDKVETWLAWQRVSEDITAGVLGEDIEADERRGVQARIRDAHGVAKEAVWADYRYIVLADRREPDGLKVIDLGAGHSSAAETLTGRVITALRSQAMLNDTVGVGYLERHWPPALAVSGAWPLSGLRQCFLDGSLTRLLDPDRALREKIIEFVRNGEFGLASNQKPDNSFEHVWFKSEVGPEEVVFESGVFLLKKSIAEQLHAPRHAGGCGADDDLDHPSASPDAPGSSNNRQLDTELSSATRQELDSPAVIRLRGPIPPEQWNRVGTRLIPKLRGQGDLTVTVDLTMTLTAGMPAAVRDEILQILSELGLQLDLEP